MDLIALLCLQCKSPMDFTGKFISTCPACGVQHALVPSDGGLMMVVSFLPYEKKLGQMERSLKLQLVTKLREVDCMAVGNDHWFSNDLVSIGEKVSYNEMIYDSDLPISIGKITVTPVIKKGFLKDLINPSINIERMCYLWVLPVMVKSGEHSVLAGHRIQIKVNGEKYENDIGELSLKIKDWFGVVPEISLQHI